jgi:hypothetical protein
MLGEVGFQANEKWQIIVARLKGGERGIRVRSFLSDINRFDAVVRSQKPRYAKDDV